MKAKNKPFSPKQQLEKALFGKTFVKIMLIGWSKGIAWMSISVALFLSTAFLIKEPNIWTFVFPVISLLGFLYSVLILVDSLIFTLFRDRIFTHRVKRVIEERPDLRETLRLYFELM